MTLADSDLVPDEVVADDTLVIATDKPLIVTTNDTDDAAYNCADDTPKTSQRDDALTTTPLSNATASTSDDESLDYSPISNGGSSESPDPKSTNSTSNATEERLSQTITTTTVTSPMAMTEEAPHNDNQLMGSDIITPSSPKPVISPILKTNANNQNSNMNGKHGETGTKTLYSLRLPGVGKVLAINSDHSCDVDTLYEQGTKACDVDAFVGNEDNTDDDDDDSDLPLYTSTVTATMMNGGAGQSHASTFNSNDEDDEFDLEANRRSITSIIRRIDPPLDPHCDPFAHRVGKKLSWRNVNMNLVCAVVSKYGFLVYKLPCCLAHIFVSLAYSFPLPFRKRRTVKRSY
jgi:hypothetical protein